MSKLGSLKPNKGSTKRRKLLGRGDASGRGSTSGKGHKGQKARSGGKIRWGFEGGQMPLARRSPKFGFKNADFKLRYEIINLTELGKFDGEVTPQTLQKAGLVKKGEPVKILARGELSKALKVKAHKLSAAAKEAIEKAGGSVEVLEYTTKRAPKETTAQQGN
jgi:large subunit ribosomal protein L15